MGEVGKKVRQRHVICHRKILKDREIEWNANIVVGVVVGGTVVVVTTVVAVVVEWIGGF